MVRGLCSDMLQVLAYRRENMDIRRPASPVVVAKGWSAERWSACAAGSNGQMTYTRLNLSAASTDPFCGTFLGSFGGNGLELLQITRNIDKVLPAPLYSKDVVADAECVWTL